MGIRHSCRPWLFACCGRLQVVVPLLAQFIFYCHHASLATCSLLPQGSAPKGGALSRPVPFLHFPFIFIRSHSSPLFTSIFCYSFPFSVHSPVSDSSTHVSRLLSVLWVPYISCVLVLDHSGLIMCTVSLFWQFTPATISYGAPFVITGSLLPCSGLVWPFSFHMYLLPFASSCHFSFTI